MSEIQWYTIHPAETLVLLLIIIAVIVYIEGRLQRRLDMKYRDSHLENQIAHMMGYSIESEGDFHIPKNLPADIIKLVRK